jgi:hypothetical protein
MISLLMFESMYSVLFALSSALNFLPRAIGSVSLRISYGYEVQEGSDPFVDLVDRATNQFSLATAPGKFLVDLIPAREAFFINYLRCSHIILVKHIPKWLPGAGFLRTAEEWAQTLVEMVELPHNFVKQELVCRTSYVFVLFIAQETG